MIWFDMLAIHPHPEPLESFTSYLIRLAQSNNLRSISALSAITFPKLKRKSTWTDLPRSTYGVLPAITGCTIEQLHATTFYHLLRKFQRSTMPATAKVFLLYSLSSTLRYCPICVAESGFYKLSWRFNHLIGCEQHGIYLLDDCGHCGSSIPLMPTPLRIGFCPTCSGDLRNCSTHLLSNEDQQHIEDITGDLTHLLSPQSWETDPHTLQLIGSALQDFRREYGWSQVDAASNLGVSVRILQAMEGSKSRSYGEKFATYLSYFRLLGKTYLEVYTRACQPENNEGQQWLERVENAIVMLKDQGKPLSQQGVCRLLSCTPPTLQRYPEIRVILLGLRTQNIQQRHERLLADVKQAVSQLQENGQKVDTRTIAALLGRSAAGLRHYPSIQQYIKTQISGYEAPVDASPRSLSSRYAVSPQLEEKYLAQVKCIVADMRANAIPFTMREVARRLGMSLTGLRAYPGIAIFLREQLEISRLDRCAVLRSRVEQAASELQRQQQAVTQRAVARQSGLSVQHLSYYPDLIAYLATFADYNLELRTRQQQERESSLYEAVITAIQQLRSDGQSVNQSTVAAALNMRVQSLKSYPSIRPIMQGIAKYAKQN